MKELDIGGKRYGGDGDSFIIAEIGQNHQGDLAICKELFRAAKACGVDAVKLQKRDNRTLYTREMYESSYVNDNSFGPTYGEHREALEFGVEEYVELQACAEELGLQFFSTVWDFKSADFLSDLNMPAYKIASADLVHTPLLEYVAKLGKPMIVSTGGGTLEDVRRAYDTIMPLNDQLCLLQCTACYPAEPKDMNLRVVEKYQELFPGAVIGLSDHQSGIAMSLLAYVLGARVFEKHFTLNRASKGGDHKFFSGAGRHEEICARYPTLSGCAGRWRKAMPGQ